MPFADVEIPILAPEHLMACKAVFNRGKDWVDIDAMRTLGRAVDTAEVLRWVARIAGDEDPRYERTRHPPHHLSDDLATVPGGKVRVRWPRLATTVTASS